MKKAIALTAALMLAAPAAATAQSQVQPLNTTTSTAGPAFLAGGLGAGGLVLGVLAIGVLAAASSTNGT